MDAKELETAIAKGIFKGLFGVLFILLFGWISSPIWIPLGLIAGEYLLRNWGEIDWKHVQFIFWWYLSTWAIIYTLDINNFKKLNSWKLEYDGSTLRSFAFFMAGLLHTAYAFFPKAISINPFLVITCVGLLAYIAFREKQWFGRW